MKRFKKASQMCNKISKTEPLISFEYILTFKNPKIAYKRTIFSFMFKYDIYMYILSRINSLRYLKEIK